MLSSAIVGTMMASWIANYFPALKRYTMIMMSIYPLLTPPLIWWTYLKKSMMLIIHPNLYTLLVRMQNKNLLPFMTNSTAESEKSTDLTMTVKAFLARVMVNSSDLLHLTGALNKPYIVLNYGGPQGQRLQFHTPPFKLDSGLLNLTPDLQT